jgi:hypothetical protein
MVFFARRRAARELDSDESNPHRSPFGHLIWVIIVWIFSAAAIGLISYNLITSSASGEAPSDFCANPSHHDNATAPFAAPFAVESPGMSSIPILAPVSEAQTPMNLVPVTTAPQA